MKHPWSTAEILQFAPDPSTARSGQDLAQRRKWARLGADEQALWGECQGSGAKPYQVQIDLSEPAFKCSCPSRKFPCKHGIGLFLLSVTAAADFTEPNRPGFVQEWLESRKAHAEKTEAKAATVEKPRDETAATKRKTDRINKIRAGMADLAAWTEDLVKPGIASMAGKSYEFFDGQARRMVDAQAPGMARLVRELGDVAASSSRESSRSATGGPARLWHARFLERLAIIHLICSATANWDTLLPDDRAALEAVFGVPVASQELNQLPSVRDIWQVVGREVEFEDRLKVQRTWLYGQQTHRPALVLDFAHGNSPLNSSLNLGLQYDTELVFYPGHSLRAAVRGSTENPGRISELSGMGLMTDLLNTYSGQLQVCPWLEKLAIPLLGVIPTVEPHGYAFLDRSGESLPVMARDGALYTLLAISGGQPINVTAEFDGTSLRPLAAFAGGIWSPLTSLETREV